ncbi:MAG: response regulator [Bacteroidales bacterium]|nr:response regulator [Bacteroidales bacterium]
MPPLNLENKKILIVEDDDLSFLYLNHILLLTKGIFIREKKGIDAIERFRSDPGFDLILMDIQLPDMDGKQVTREIRKLDGHIPIIAQTASRSTLERDQMLEAGCSDVLNKPFSMDELFAMIGRYIGQVS